MTHNLKFKFPSLPDELRASFRWDSPAWWEWFTAFKRRPSLRAVARELDRYEAFICFHGARPTGVAEYYQDGLRIADSYKLNQRARHIFLSGRFPGLTSGLLEEAIARAPTCHDKMLFVQIDGRELSGHYLIYGSEHICGLAASLTERTGYDVRQVLKHFGVPTLFRLAVPRQIIPNGQPRALAIYILEYCWEDRKQSQPPTVDWSFFFRQSLPASVMIDHIHPESIPDPLLQYHRYSYRDNFPCFY